MPLDQTHTYRQVFASSPSCFCFGVQGPGIMVLSGVCVCVCVSGLGWDFESLKCPRIVLPRASAVPRPPKTRGSTVLEIFRPEKS